MLFRRIEDPTLAQYAYLIGCQRSGEAIVIDPERDVDRYIEAARREKLRIVAVAETHIHADFLSGARELAEREKAHVFVSGEGGSDWQSNWATPYKHTILRDGTPFKVGNIHFTAVHTPGHTPEHMSYLVYDRGGNHGDHPMGMLTGDFVFVGDLGRPDLLETAAGIKGIAELSARTLWRSATNFMAQPDYLQVWPAHGAGSACGKALGAVPQSTVGYEKMTSPILQLVDDEQAFVDDILSGQPAPPLYFARMKMENRDGVPLLNALPVPHVHEDLRSGADLCDPKRTVVVDTRPWNDFRVGHLPGSILAMPGTMFPMSVGTYVQPGDAIALVCDAARAEEYIRNLVRIGLDKVVAVIPPSALQAGSLPAGVKLEATPQQSVQEMAQALDAGDVFVLDVRNANEHAQGAVSGSWNTAYTRLPRHLHELPRDKRILVHCALGGRSATATAYLRRQGFDAVNISGGFEAWKKAGLPVQLPAGAGA